MDKGAFPWSITDSRPVIFQWVSSDPYFSYKLDFVYAERLTRVALRVRRKDQ
jgi:hypothetical protein